MQSLFVSSQIIFLLFHPIKDYVLFLLFQVTDSYHSSGSSWDRKKFNAQIHVSQMEQSVQFYFK